MAASRRDLLLAALSLWWVGGLHLDGWAHLHLPGLETFFTPWHAVLYSGFAATALAVAVDAWRNTSAPRTWNRLDAIRKPTVAGVFVFTIGGALDLAWHRLFGIEASTEALVSPTHLLLAVGLVLVVSDPLRRGLHEGLPRGSAAVPFIVSASLMLSVLTFFTQVYHPYGRPWMAAGNRPVDATWALQDPQPVFSGASGVVPSVDIAQIAGLASIVVQTLFLMGLVLMIARRGRLPFGGFAMLFLLNGTLMGLMRGQMFAIPVSLAGGILADVLAAWLEPTPERPAAARWFAGLVPFLLYVLYVLVVRAVYGTWWDIHLLAGVPVMAGIAGVLVSLVAVPAASRAATL